MSDLSLEYLKENKCSEEGCFRFRAKGYIFCEGHLHGFPKSMDDEDVERLNKCNKVKIEWANVF